jgi:hypothetical protein
MVVMSRSVGGAGGKLGLASLAVHSLKKHHYFIFLARPAAYPAVVPADAGTHTESATLVKHGFPPPREVIATNGSNDVVQQADKKMPQEPCGILLSARPVLNGGCG